MTRAWPRSRMAPRIAAAAFWAATVANELLSLKTFNTISWLLLQLSRPRSAVKVGELYKNPNDHEPRPCGSRTRWNRKHDWSRSLKVKVSVLAGNWTDYTDESDGCPVKIRPGDSSSPRLARNCE